jgi:hypothetical protein
MEEVLSALKIKDMEHERELAALQRECDAKMQQVLTSVGTPQQWAHVQAQRLTLR